jgi:predicted nucleic acid-binding Zn ribbon protein
MKYPLVQYQCNNCGDLTDAMDCDERLPKGWVIVESNVHYCPKCSKIIKHILT